MLIPEKEVLECLVVPESKALHLQKMILACLKTENNLKNISLTKSRTIFAIKMNY